MTEPQWLDPDPVAAITEWKVGALVEIQKVVGLAHCVGPLTTLGDLQKFKYRAIHCTPPESRTYELCDAHRAYCEGKWVRWRGFTIVEWWHIIHNPIGMLMIADDGWLIREDDPRELTAHSNEIQPIEAKPVHSQVGVHEALRVWECTGKVRSPSGKVCKRPPNGLSDHGFFFCEPVDIGKPWTVLEEPPCHA